LRLAAHQRVSKRCADGAALDEFIEEYSELGAVLVGCPGQLAFLLDDDIGMDRQVSEYFGPKVCADGYRYRAGINPAFTISSMSSSLRLGSAAFMRMGGFSCFLERLVQSLQVFVVDGQRISVDFLAA